MEGRSRSRQADSKYHGRKAVLAQAGKDPLVPKLPEQGAADHAKWIGRGIAPRC